MKTITSIAKLEKVSAERTGEKEWAIEIHFSKGVFVSLRFDFLDIVENKLIKFMQGGNEAFCLNGLVVDEIREIVFLLCDVTEEWGSK